MKCYYCNCECFGYDGGDKQHCIVFKGEWPHDYGDGSYTVDFAGYKSDPTCPMGWGETTFVHDACCNCAKEKGMDGDEFTEHCCSSCKSREALSRSTEG
eukprot:CAMPEP_0196747568 /NCGR_PEP_ID=MMETSP1091-20130531/70365_1 /TAXON_ID=302021 /ORGANISM="Rhodomonas sp., Strain CCMP768" /LENGTH=98 /DNA_ID=CAMNT_0042094743 /DNA_START=1 /DNA_END=297 /DNA_ORIENTATION=+